jgi:hypothetical protein
MSDACMVTFFPPAQDLIHLLVNMSQAVVNLYRCGHDKTKCKATFSTKEALQQHQKSVHLSVPKPPKYACGVLGCSKVYEQHAQLVLHTNDKHRSKRTGSGGNNGTQTSSSDLDPHLWPQQPLAANTPSSSGPRTQKYPCGVPTCSRVYESEIQLL